jgi:hypothetical protein
MRLVESFKSMESPYEESSTLAVGIPAYREDGVAPKVIPNEAGSLPVVSEESPASAGEPESPIGFFIDRGNSETGEASSESFRRLVKPIQVTPFGTSDPDRAGEVFINEGNVVGGD